MKFYLICKHFGDPDTASWKEEYDQITSDPNAFCQDLIGHFNRTLRRSERARVYLGYEVVAEESTLDNAKPAKHLWDKMNCYTQARAGRTYDVMKCQRCGAWGKRFGLGEQGTVLDSKYRKSLKYVLCKPTEDYIESSK